MRDDFSLYRQKTRCFLIPINHRQLYFPSSSAQSRILLSNVEKKNPQPLSLATVKGQVLGQHAQFSRRCFSQNDDLNNGHVDKSTLR
jgi:hypothetical protein